jgi:hypothetical protein
MDRVIFVWGGGKWKRTLPLHKPSKVGIMWSAPSNHKFYAFAAQVEPTVSQMRGRRRNEQGAQWSVEWRMKNLSPSGKTYLSPLKVRGSHLQ